MANTRNTLDSDRLDLDRLDLDDLDFGGGENDAPKDGPVKRFTQGFRRGFLKDVQAKTMMRNFALNALPDGYARTARSAMQVSSDVRKMRDEIIRGSAHDLSEIMQATDRVLPNLKKVTSEKTYERIQALADKTRKRIERDLHTGYSETESHSQDDLDSRLIAETIAETTAYVEQSERERFSAERTERSVRDRISAGRFEMVNERIAGIADDLRASLNYQDQVTYRFQKKSLELQYRSFFALRDIRELAVKSRETDDRAYSALVHNTSLPEHRKVSDAERVRFGVDNQISDRITDKLVESLPQFLSGFYGRVVENIQGRIQSGVTQAGQAAGLGNLGADMTAGADGVGLTGEGAGQAASGFLQQFAMGRLAGKAKPHLERLSDRAGGVHNYLSYLMDNAPSMLRDYTTDIEQSYGWRGTIQDIVRSVVPQHYLDDNLPDGSYQTIDRQAAFNQLTQRSIVEIIPGYLSRLLQETRMLRTGRDDIDREVYDVTSGKFVGYKAASKSMLGRIVKEGNRRNIDLTMDEAIRGMDQDGTLSTAAQTALRERLLRDASRGGHFDPRAYAEGGYGDNVDNDTLAELASFFGSQFEFDAEGRTARNADNNRKLKQYSDAFLKLRSVVPDPRSELRRVMGSGSQEFLRDLGLVITEQGEDKINYDRIWELYSSDRTGINSDTVEASTANPLHEDYTKQSFADIAKRRAASVTSDLRDRLGRVDLDPRKLRSSIDDVGQGIADKTDVVKQRAMSAQEDFKRRLEQSKFTPQNLYPQGSVVPLLTARGIAAGEYIDANTNRIIRSLADITGDVKNHYGHVEATAIELAGTLHNDLNETVVLPGLKDRVLAKLNAANGFRAKIQQTVGDNIRQKLLAVKDVYVRGKEGAVLYAKEFNAGRYFDAKTKEPLNDADDIQGAVVDTDGNTVLTEEEFQAGLIDATGATVTTTRGTRFAKAYLRTTSTPMRFIGRHLGNALRQAGQGTLDFLLGRNRDAYIYGEESPRIVASKMDRGHYFDQETGDPVTSFDNIKGTIVDRDGNILVDASEIPNLVTIEGKKHPIAKKPGLISKLFKKAAGGYWNLTKRYYRGLGRFAKKLYKPGQQDGGKPVDRKIPKWLRDSDEEVSDKTISTPTDGLLNRIYKVLNKRLPPEAHRKGSWQEEFANREKDADGADKEGDESLKAKGLFGSLGAGIKSLFNMFRKNQDEDGGDGDTYVNTGDMGLGGDGDGDDKDKKDKGKGDGKDRKKPRPKGVKGWLKHGAGKTWQGTKWVGKKVALPAAMLAGRLAVTAAVGLVSLVGLPVIIGVGAAAAAAGGAYWYLNKRAKANGDFVKLRALQYGQSIEDRDAANKIFALESYMEEITERNAGGAPTFDTSKFDPEKMLDILEIEKSNEAHIEQMSLWFQNRFKPIYIAYQKALTQIAPQLELSDLTDKIPESDGLRLLEAVRQPYTGNTPYVITALPFSPDATTTVTVEEIKAQEDLIRSKYTKGNTTPNTTSTATAAGVIAANVSKGPTPTQGGSTPTSTLAHKARLSAGELNTTTPNIPTGRGLLMASSVKMVKPRLTSVSSFLRVRLYGYGVDEYTLRDVQSLISMEDAVLEYIKFDSKGQATFDGNANDYLREFGGLFGVADDDSPETTQWVAWFNTRFLGVVLTYAAAIRGLNNSITLARAESGLTDDEKLSVVRAIIAAKVPFAKDTRSIWDIPHTPWGQKDAAAYKEMRRKAADTRDQIQAVNEAVQQMGGVVIKEDTTRPADTAVTDKQEGDRSVQGATNRAINKARREWGGAALMVNTQIPRAAMGSPTALGSTSVTLAQGNGGVWESIPLPKSNRSREGAMDTLNAVAAMTGVDANLLATFASIESAFDYLVKASTSSATGWFQFINSTWDWMLSKFGSKYQIPADDGQRSLRKDPRINALMGAEFLKSNFSILQSRLGRTPTDTDLYLAHFLGAGTAVQFLKADSNALAAPMFRKQANANKNIFFKPGGGSRTIGEVYQLMDEKVSKHRGHGPELATRQPHSPVDINATGNGSSADFTDEVQLAPTDVAGAIVPASAVPAPSARETMSRRTAATQGPPGTFNAGLGTSTGVMAMPAEATTSTDPVMERHETARRQALVADRRQMHSTEQSLAHSKEIGRIAEKQLKTQEEMRDYLKELTGIFGGIQKDGMKIRTGTEEANKPEVSNDTSKRPSSHERVSAKNTPAPIRMNRN